MCVDREFDDGLAAPNRDALGYAMSLSYRDGKDIIRIAGTQASLLLLRDDEDALRTYLRWLSDERINMWISQSDQTGSMESEREWARSTAHADGMHTYNILDMRSRRIVGNCSVRMRGTNAVLGILIGAPEARNHGLGTAVMRMLVRFSFDELGAHRIELGVMAENERAMRCYEKAGFVEYGCRHEDHWYGGVWRDVVEMEILRSDWEERLRDEYREALERH